MDAFDYSNPFIGLPGLLSGNSFLRLEAYENAGFVLRLIASMTSLDTDLSKMLKTTLALRNAQDNNCLRVPRVLTRGFNRLD